MPSFLPLSYILHIISPKEISLRLVVEFFYLKISSYRIKSLQFYILFNMIDEFQLFLSHFRIMVINLINTGFQLWFWISNWNIMTYLLTELPYNIQKNFSIDIILLPFCCWYYFINHFIDIDISYILQAILQKMIIKHKDFNQQVILYVLM